MKRVKLMLLSFCVLAAVGGALAFKAKGNLDFCYAVANSQADFCKDGGVIKKCPDHTDIGNQTVQNFFYCTTPSTGTSTPCSINGVALNCGTISAQVTTTE